MCRGSMPLQLASGVFLGAAPGLGWAVILMLLSRVPSGLIGGVGGSWPRTSGGLGPAAVW